ncbi:MAG: T9SS type A sorting domain-containing protein [Bacteroidia bacterium]
MKKNILLLLIILTSSKWGTAQNIFGKLTYWGGVLVTEQFKKSDLMCSLISQDDTSNSLYDKGIICKHTNKGEIIKQLIIYSDSNNGILRSTFSSFIFVDSFNNFEVFGVYYKDSTYGIFLNKYDFDLNLLSQKFLDFGATYTDSSGSLLHLNKVIKLENGNYWITAIKVLNIQSATALGYYDDKSFLILTDSELKIKKVHQEDLTNSLNTYLNNIVVSSFNLGEIIVSKVPNQGKSISIQTYDSNLVLKGSISYPKRNTNSIDTNIVFPNLINYPSMVSTNNRLLITGTDYAIPTDSSLNSFASKNRLYDPINIFSLNPINMMVDKKNIIVDWDLIRDIELEGYFISKSGFGNRIAISKTNQIYVFNFYGSFKSHVDTSQIEPIFTNSFKYYLVVSKFDNDLNLVWSKRIKDLPYFNFSDITVSQNSIFLTGFEDKGLVNNMYYHLPAILQLDTFGNFTNSIKPVNKLASSQIVVYPNPTTDNVVNFEMNYEQMTSLAIYTLTGKQVYNIDFVKPTSTFRLNLNDYANGIYFYKVNTQNNQSITGKLIKQ